MGKNNSSWKAKAERLREECDWTEPISTAFARAGGRCEYCGSDLLHDRLGYGVGLVDHLLPKASYPDLKDCPDNWVYSCRPCNDIKHAFDVGTVEGS